MATQAQITASVNNSPQHLLERMMVNPDQTTTVPPQVTAAGVSAATILTALASVGIVESI